MPERWYRWYDGTSRDGKFRLVADWVEESVATVLGVWASLLEDAATSDPRGTATKGIEHHSMYLDLDSTTVKKIWNALERVGTVRNAGNADDRSSAVLVINWDSRQFESDAKDPTAKQRKEKWKQSHNNKSVPKRSTERLGTPETETETETEKNIVRLNELSLNGEAVKRQPRKQEKEIEAYFIEFYAAYPKRQSRKTAARAYSKARAEGVSHETIMAGLERAKKSDSRFREQKFIPLPASWLNAGGYSDETVENQEWKRAIF